MPDVRDIRRYIVTRLFCLSTTFVLHYDTETGGGHSGIIASGVSSDGATPATVASGVAALQISDPEYPVGQGTSADVDSERQQLRPRQPPQGNRPTDFRFMKRDSPMGPQQVGYKALGVDQSHLVNVMVPREDVYSAKDKPPADVTEADMFFFTAVEDYHKEGIILPAALSSNNAIGGTVVPESEAPAQLKRQVSNVVEERDKIVSELFKQKANFERAVVELKNQRDELSGENNTLKTALNDLRSKLDVSETSVQHLVSEHKRLDGLLSHAERISAQHQLESETLQRTIVMLKEENSTALRDRDAVIEKLEARCDELDKKIVSLNAAHLEEIRRAETRIRKIELANALERTKEEYKSSKVEHENGMQTLKAKLYDVDDHKRNMEAMEKKNVSLEEEIQKLKASPKEHERRRAGEHSAEEETAVESEATETPDKSKAYVGLGKRRNADLDSAEPQEKKSRHDLSDYGAESARGRSKLRNIGRRWFGRSESRATTPDTMGTPGSAKKGADKNSDDVFSLGFRRPPGAAALTPPGPIAPSTSTTSTGTANNADDEASAFGDDDGVKSSPAGVSGTPKIAITKVNGEKNYLLVNVDPASAVFDPAESGRENESRWPPLKARSVSRERPPRLKSVEEPVSPTPASATHRHRSRSPFPQLRRPVPVHGASAPTHPSHRALSPPPSTPRRVTSPALQTTGQSRKRKAEPELGQGVVIRTWYDDERHPKKNRT
ncbi:hypothetical protein BJ912DRAFT_936062 [Pholiota molesta]|nr:hypothetical protein BJ912DRAFT_936062 [Pholiota molesta]